LEKFFKLDNAMVPICNKCGTNLKSSNWSESREKKQEYVCNDCNYATTKKNRALKTLSVDNTKHMIGEKSIQSPAYPPNQLLTEV
jgi:DNA-directed RNA polymerase subunit RPC12/RpoP